MLIPVQPSPLDVWSCAPMVALVKEAQIYNEQFENIRRLKAEYETAGNPIVSMDTKKKEQLGNFYRDGHLYTLEELHTYDHDFSSFSEGVIIPIEHRLFPHVTRACQGVIFTSIDVVKHLMRKTQTSRGLRVFVHILDKLYQTGRQVADDFKRHMAIVHDSFLPQWNYCVIPPVSGNGKVI